MELLHRLVHSSETGGFRPTAPGAPAGRQQPLHRLETGRKTPPSLEGRHGNLQSWVRVHERQDCAETASLQQLATALAPENSCTTNQSISLGEQAITVGINKKLETVPLGVTSKPWDAIIKVLDVVIPLLFSQAGPGLSLAPRDSSCTFQPLR